MCLTQKKEVLKTQDNLRGGIFMKRRTKKTILADAKRILYESRDSVSLKEISEKLNLTISQVRTSVKSSGMAEQVSNLLKNSKASKKCREECRKSKNKGDRKDRHYHGINTLANVSVSDGKCILNIQSNENVYVELVSNSYIYADGLHELNVGDEVYVARLTKGFLLVIHYDVINLDVKQNVRVRYTKKMNLEERNIDINFDFEHVVFARDALAHFKKVRNL